MHSPVALVLTLPRPVWHVDLMLAHGCAVNKTKPGVDLRAVAGVFPPCRFATFHLDPVFTFAEGVPFRREEPVNFLPPHRPQW